MRFILMSLVVLLWQPLLLAQTFFDFTHDNVFARSPDPIALDFNYLLVNATSSQFRVRPVLATGMIKIYDTAVDSWIPGGFNWLQLPVLAKSLVITIPNFTSEYVDLHFEIMHLDSGRIFKTPVHKIWNRNVSDEYLRKINANILNHNL